MKYLIIFFSICLYALDLSNKSLAYLFKNQYYTYICEHRWRYINKYVKKREDLLSLVAYSCIKKRYITYALDLAKNLRFTKLGRNNANYIATLFNIKTLLRRYLVDNISLDGIELPYVADNDLGRVFFLIKKQNPKVVNNIVFLKDGNKNIKVSYSVDSDEIILEFLDKNNNLIKKEKYW